VKDSTLACDCFVHDKEIATNKVASPVKKVISLEERPECYLLRNKWWKFALRISARKKMAVVFSEFYSTGIDGRLALRSCGVLVS